jgi:hypothetical protein
MVLRNIGEGDPDGISEDAIDRWRNFFEKNGN